MAEALASLFKFSQWTIVRARNVVAASAAIDKLRAGRQILQHLFSIILPVGSHVQITALLNFLCQQIDKCRLEDTALMMTFFMPGVRKIKLHSCYRLISNLLLQKRYSIGASHPQIRQLIFLNRF